MIHGNFKNWHPVWENKDNSIKVEKTQPSYRDKREDKEPIIIDVTIAEEESETEDFYDDEYKDISVTIESEDITWDVTVPVVNNSTLGYNKKGHLEKLKIKSKTLKIV
tara:strand:+ start:880 stop:1203 length:324 start_codon:yes stop_codon:yes gene_type:complete